MRREKEYGYLIEVFRIFFCLMIFLGVADQTVKAEIVCNTSCPSFSFIDTEGNTVTNETTKGVATILVFSRANCTYTTAALHSIGISDWFPNNNVKLVMGLLDGTSDDTKAYQEQNCYDGMTFCYTETTSEMSTTVFSIFHKAGGEGLSFSTPLIVILDPDGNIRWVSEGAIDSDSIAAQLDDYVDLGYSIDDVNIKVKIVLNGEMVYTGDAYEPKVYVEKGPYGILLREGKHYAVSYENNVNAGTACAVVSGLGYMKGNKRLEFQILPINLSKASIGTILEQNYTGNEVMPEVSVTYEGKVLVKGTDYTISYSDNVNPGTASVQIIGKGNYTGEKITSFVIVAPKVEVQPEVTSFEVNGQAYSVADANKKEVLCVGLADKSKKKVTIPQYVNYGGVKYCVVAVSAKSFKNNKKVTQISIATSITEIGDSCFEGCTNLKSVTVGKSLQVIGKNAFKNCKNLNKITIKSVKLRKVGKNAFKGINAKCKIKVPKKQLKKYKKLLAKKGQKSSVKISS